MTLRQLTSEVRIAPCVFIIAFLLMIACASILSRGYVLSADEVQYADQAQRMSKGVLSSPAPGGKSFYNNSEFMPPHSLTVGNRVIAKYAPGFPMALAVGYFFGKPEWINPAFAAAGLALFYSMLEISFGVEWSVIATLLLGLNPIYWGYGQSYFPHTMVNTLLLYIAWLALNPIFRISNMMKITMCAATILLVNTRLPEALCVTAALFFFAQINRNIWYVLPAFIGLLLGLPLLYWYHFLLIGKPALSLYGAGDITLVDLFAGKYELVPYLHWYMHGLSVRTGTLLWDWYIRFSGYLYPFIGMMGIALAYRFFKNMSVMLLLLCAMILGFYSIVPYMGYPFLGMRYQSFLVIALGAFAILPFWWLEKRYSRQTAFMAASTLIVWQLFVAEQQFAGYKLRYDYTENMYKAIAEQCDDQTLALFVRQWQLRPYFVAMGVTRTYWKNMPITAAPALTASKKKIHVHELDKAALLRMLAKHYSKTPLCIPEYASPTELINDINAAQPFFLSHFDNDNKSYPPVKESTAR